MFFLWQSCWCIISFWRDHVHGVTSVELGWHNMSGHQANMRLTSGNIMGNCKANIKPLTPSMRLIKVDVVSVCVPKAHFYRCHLRWHSFRYFFEWLYLRFIFLYEKLQLYHSFEINQPHVQIFSLLRLIITTILSSSFANLYWYKRCKEKPCLSWGLRSKNDSQ